MFEGVANQPWSPHTHRRGTIIVVCFITGVIIPFKIAGGTNMSSMNLENVYHQSRNLLQIKKSYDPNSWVVVFINSKFKKVAKVNTMNI